MGPPNGGPEGNNHEDDEVGDSDGQIWKLAVGVSVYSQQETFKKLHYFLYFLHFSSHSTRNIPKIEIFPFFSSFFIAFNKKHSKIALFPLFS
jgi:hypothetical protein